MGFSNLATALTVIFFVSVVALISQLVYVLWRHRSFRRHSSPPPPISIGDQTPDFPTADAATKELLYFFCLKPHLPAVDPSKLPTKSTDASSPNDEVVDVFKLLEANGPSRFLCTIKEEDKEDVDSKTSDVDSANRSTKNYAGLQSGVEVAREPVAAAEEEEVSMTVDGDDQNESTKTEFSTPCDSPLFFTPAGSPSRDHMELDFVVTIHGITGNMDER